MRTFVCALATLLVLGVSLIAAELKGTIKSTDKDKKIVTISVDGKDTEVSITDDTKFFQNDKAAKDRDKAVERLYKAKEGTKITVVTEKKDGKEVATEVRTERAKKN